MSDLKRKAKEHWKDLCVVPLDENKCLLEPWNGFEKGTDQVAIWRWFEDAFLVSVVKDLMEYKKPQARFCPFCGSQDTACVTQCTLQHTDDYEEEVDEYGVQ